MTEHIESFQMAPMDMINKVSTAVSLLLIAMAALFLFAMFFGALGGAELSARGPAMIAVVIIVAAVAFVLTLLVAVYRPSGLRVSPVGVQIVWPLRSRLIRPEDIQSVAQIDHQRMGRVYRAFGMGGLFGTFGLCRTGQLGFVDAYITRRTNAVLIVRRSGCGRPLLITPERPDEFVAAVAAVAAGSPG